MRFFECLTNQCNGTATAFLLHLGEGGGGLGGEGGGGLGGEGGGGLGGEGGGGLRAGRHKAKHSAVAGR